MERASALLEPQQQSLSLKTQPLIVSPKAFVILRCALRVASRYPRACHLICLRVSVEQESAIAGATAPKDGGGPKAGAGALTPSKGKGRAMHGQRMVEWLEVSEAPFDEPTVTTRTSPGCVSALSCRLRVVVALCVVS